MDVLVLYKLVYSIYLLVVNRYNYVYNILAYVWIVLFIGTIIYSNSNMDYIGITLVLIFVGCIGILFVILLMCYSSTTERSLIPDILRGTSIMYVEAYLYLAYIIYIHYIPGDVNIPLMATKEVAGITIYNYHILLTLGEYLYHFYVLYLYIILFILLISLIGVIWILHDNHQ